MNVSPASASPVSAEVISFKLLISASRPGREAKDWCETNRLTVASKARHAELCAGFAGSDFVGVAALVALTEKRLTGALPAGSFLLLDSLPSLSHLHGTELILQLVKLAAADVTIVTLGAVPRAWAKDLSDSLAMFLWSFSELYLRERQRELHSERIRGGLKSRRERIAKEGCVEAQ